MCQGQLTKMQKLWHINCLEMKAVVLSLLRFRFHLQKQNVQQNECSRRNFKSLERETVGMVSEQCCSLKAVYVMGQPVIDLFATQKNKKTPVF